MESCKKEFKDGNNRKTIENLHEALEKLVKAYALYFGLLKEEKLKTKISHKPLKVYIKLLSKHWIGKVQSLFNIKVNISQSWEQLERLSNLDLEEPEDIEEVLKLDKNFKFFLNYIKILWGS